MIRHRISMPARWQYGTVSKSAARAACRPKSGRAGPVKGSALQLLVALAVIAAALLDPFQPAIGVGSLVGIVLIDASMHAALAGGFLGIFRIHGSGEHCRPCRSGRRRGFGGLRLGFHGLRRGWCCWCGSRRGGGGRRGGRAALPPSGKYSPLALFFVGG